MPFVTVKLLKGVYTPEVKAKLIAGVSNAVAEVVAEGLGTDKEKVLAHLWCVIEEVELENWGSGGRQVNSEMLKAAFGSQINYP